MVSRMVRGSMLLFFAAASWSADPAPKTPPLSTGQQPQAHSLPEVRLRKLHLVRPDLIPYPIAMEVYC